MWCQWTNSGMQSQRIIPRRASSDKLSLIAAEGCRIPRVLDPNGVRSSTSPIPCFSELLAYY